MLLVYLEIAVLKPELGSTLCVLLLYSKVIILETCV